MRFPLVSAALAILVAVFVVIFATGTTTITNVTRTPAAMVPSIASSTSAITLPSLFTTTAAPSLPPIAAAPKVTTKTATVAPAQPAAPIATVPATTSVSSDAGITTAGTNLRAALVNIICYAQGSSLQSISGSGVIIDSRGIILTAAHIGQYFLLANYPNPGDVSCTIRTGSPAEEAYTAEPIYVSPSWINANANVLVEDDPVGTGQNDFALLAITGSATSAPLPASFPSIPVATNDSNVGDSVVIGSYGAQFLSTQDIESSLFPTLVYGSVKDIYTFGVNTPDVISLGGTAAAQEGSSGGGVVNAQGQLVGLITTSTTAGDTAARDLRAITPSHIRASFYADTGNSFDTYFAARSLSSLIALFAPTARTLENTLIAHIQAAQ